MKKTSFLIAGKHAVTEALKNPNRRVLKVFLNEESKKTLNRENLNLDLLKNIKLFYKSKKELDRMCSKEQISHQSLLAEIEHLEEESLKNSDFLLKINIYHKIESLNIANSAAVVFHYINKLKKKINS